MFREADGTCRGGKLGCGAGGSPPLHPQEGRDQPACPWQGRAQGCLPPPPQLQVPAAKLQKRHSPSLPRAILKLQTPGSTQEMNPQHSKRRQETTPCSVVLLREE